MGLNMFFVAALAVTAASLALALHLKVRKTGRGILTPMNVLFAGVILGGILLFTPAYFVQQHPDGFRGTKSLLLAIYSTMRLFMGDGDYTVVTDGISDERIASCYMAMMSVLQVMAPMLTAGAIISIFYNLSSQLQYLTSYNKDICIFTELNEGSLILARDMKKNHPKAAIVFSGIRPEETDAELQEEARNMGAVLFRKDVMEVPVDAHSKKRSIWFFAVSSNEQANIHHGLMLAERFSDRDRTNLYVFATSMESEALFSTIRGKKMHIRRINTVRSVVNRMLYDDGMMFYRDAICRDDGEKWITAVVVGMGEYGKAMLKALTWFCQMDGYRIRIHVFDDDELAEEKFAMECPELMSEMYNGVCIPGETSYTIKFHPEIRIGTKSFADTVSQITEATYVLVDLGSEDKNIEMAITLRTLLERSHNKAAVDRRVREEAAKEAAAQAAAAENAAKEMPVAEEKKPAEEKPVEKKPEPPKPVIQVVISSAEKKKALQGLKNFKGREYNLIYIGDPEFCYTENVILDSEIEADALLRHLRYGNEEEFWAYEYNYRSSIALAIGARIRRELGIPGADIPEDKLEGKVKEDIELLEHRRWNAYMRSEGYVFSGCTKKWSRNDMAKVHHDLTDFQSLPEEEKRKDSLVGTA